MRKITGKFPSKTKTLKIEFFWFECHSAEKRNAVCILTTNPKRLSCAHFTPLNNTEMSLSRKTNTLTKHMAGWHVLSSNRKKTRRDSSVQHNTAHLSAVYSRVSTMFTLHYYTIGNQCIQYLSVTKISISYLNLLTIVKKIKIEFFFKPMKVRRLVFKPRYFITCNKDKCKKNKCIEWKWGKK